MPFTAIVLQSPGNRFGVMEGRVRHGMEVARVRSGWNKGSVRVGDVGVRVVFVQVVSSIMRVRIELGVLS